MLRCVPLRRKTAGTVFDRMGNGAETRWKGRFDDLCSYLPNAPAVPYRAYPAFAAPEHFPLRKNDGAEKTAGWDLGDVTA